jgi:branched-subunit amino acid ABC-type transport system permease component
MGIYEISLATVVGINIILALGLNMITGFCGQISLGHAAFYGVGAYTWALLAKAGTPLPLAIAAGMISAGTVGLFVGLASLLVEQSTQRALEVADRVCVLESGKTVWQGTAEKARDNAGLIDALLGLREDG